MAERGARMKIEEEIKTQKFSTPQQKAVINILYTASWFNSMHSKFLKKWEISTQQYNVLRILNGHSPNSMTVQMIKDRMLDKTPNTTRLVDKLLSKGLAGRKRSRSDRRVVFVSITDQGKSLLEQTDSFFKYLDSYLSSITENEAHYVCGILDKMRDAEKNLMDFISESEQSASMDKEDVRQEKK
jgi:DNA-binding MarR family transcriptional regulator